MNPELARNAVLAHLRGRSIGSCPCGGELNVHFLSGNPPTWNILCEKCHAECDVGAPYDHRSETKWAPARGIFCPFDATKLVESSIDEEMQPRRKMYLCVWCGAQTIIP